MTDVAIASSHARDHEAGRELGQQLRKELGDQPADAVIVFASSQNDYAALLEALDAACSPRAIVGCSSAGEFTRDASGTGMSTAMAIRAGDMEFRPSLARGLSGGRDAAADALVANFAGLHAHHFRYHTALLFVDALAGHTEELVDRLTTATAGLYRFVGGGAGDDGLFKKTHVFFGTEAHTDAVVGLEILSNKPFGIGARHGWTPASEPLRVTEACDSCMVSLNVSPAVEVFEEHAASTRQKFDVQNPMPFFLHNIVGVKTADGHKLRVPLGTTPEGGVLTAAEVPTGATAHIMGTESRNAAAAAATAVQDAVDQVTEAGHTPRAALFFDCVATRLRLGQDFGDELEAVKRELKDAPFAGFNSYGQIVRADGQFSGFHNCTAVVCVIPE